MGATPSQPSSQPNDLKNQIIVALNIENGTESFAVLDKILKANGDRGWEVLAEIALSLPPNPQSTALYELANGPESNAIRNLFFQMAESNNLMLCDKGVTYLVDHADSWPAELQQRVIRLALRSLTFEMPYGPYVWLARRGAKEALPFAQKRLEKLAKTEGLGERYKLEQGMVSGQGYCLLALAILGEKNARKEIRDSLTQDMDKQRLAWGLWMAAKTREPSWAPLIAEHLSDTYPALYQSAIHDRKGRQGKTFIFRMDALAAQALAACTGTKWSFETGEVAESSGEYDYPLIPDKTRPGWSICPIGFSPSQMEEVRTWWAKNKARFSATQPTSQPFSPAKKENKSSVK